MVIFFFFRYSLLLLVLILILNDTPPIYAAEEVRQVYIVYMGNLVEGDQNFPSYHLDMLQQVVDSRFLGQSLVKSYSRSFNGFAANLTAQERENLANHEDVVSIFPSISYYPETTRSWDFMGISENIHRNPTVETDIIIGVIDSGIWPESESFNDKGFSPPPKKWKGACKGGNNFTCNNKIIGARVHNSLSFPDDSARDIVGHGTHCASVAAGNHVRHASFYGIAKGTARGGVPSARIAVYKVCFDAGCQLVDLLAAFDDAIADGVDIITISIGGPQILALTNDTISIGALHASLRGILVVQSAGNMAMKKSITSTAPWILSVAASSTDRAIITKVVLGNGTILAGKGVNSFRLNRTSYPLVAGEDVVAKAICRKEMAKYCIIDCLDPALVEGKIVMCNSNKGIAGVYRGKAVGSVALSDYYSDVSLVLPIAASGLNAHDFNIVQSYFNSTKFPIVDIMTSESGRNLDAPLVASFSSRGPNSIIPDILKPDVTAPGTEILASFSPLASPSYNFGDNRRVNFNILSGTSMSCPHVAGAAAYVKSLHPNWSASAIKSALMTTAWRMDASKDPLAEFSYGAGHIDPVKATNPGLAYETNPEDYVKLLCSLGYDTAKVRKIFGVNSSCSNGGLIRPKDLNYPSMTAHIKTNSKNVVTFSEKFTRTVTNLGTGNSTYKVITTKSSDYIVSVKPSILAFGAENEKKSFEVVIRGKTNAGMVSASLEWSDGVHSVRSPIVLYTDNL